MDGYAALADYAVNIAISEFHLANTPTRANGPGRFGGGEGSAGRLERIARLAGRLALGFAFGFTLMVKPHHVVPKGTDFLTGPGSSFLVPAREDRLDSEIGGRNRKQANNQILIPLHGPILVT